MKPIRKHGNEEGTLGSLYIVPRPQYARTWLYDLLTLAVGWKLLKLVKNCHASSFTLFKQAKDYVHVGSKIERNA